MSVRNLKRLFEPSSVALIGASRRHGSLGAVLAHNLFTAGFSGSVLPVHPEYEAVEGVLAYDSVADLPLTPDLAVIATPPASVPGLIAELAARGTRAAVVITAGFGEGADEGGLALRQQMLDAARPHILRIVGPNCLGVIVPEIGLNASFSHVAPERGDLAFVTQSGAMITAMLDWAAPRGIGFSKIVSLGDMSDVDFGDMLDYLATDNDTRAVLLYIESITHARKFMSAARACARTKPVIVIKAGRHAAAAKAAATHTGALAGADEVYDAVIARAGMLRVYSLHELFDAAATLAMAKPGRGDRIAILTNGGGLGVLATDALIDEGGQLAELAPETVARLDAALPPTWSHGNPVDIVGDAPGERYRDAAEILLEDPNTDALLALNCPTAVSSSTEAAEAIIAVATGHRRPVFAAWVGDGAGRAARARLSEAHIPAYETPEQAARGLMHLERYRRNQQQLMETPPSQPESGEPDRAQVRRLVEAALAGARAWLSEAESKRVLAAYGIPVIETRIAETPEAAVAAAREIGFPVALKILSPDVTHKLDVGGVALNLTSVEEVAAAAKAVARRLRAARPDARLEGFTVQEMCHRPEAEELILGMTVDAQFGPIILFGQGGSAVEVLRDRAVALPPLNMMLARALMARTRVHALLQGYRGRPPAALDEIADALVKLSQLVIDTPEIAGIDINPLLADSRGVVALDARIAVAPASAPGAARLAIRPYPQELEERLRLPDGQPVLLRPIRPEDEPALRAAFLKLTAEDVRMRFFAPLRELSHAFAARLTQIDYNREMALIAVDPASAGAKTEIWGVARIAADPDDERAEFAVTVRSDMKGRGLGTLLMRRLIAYSAARGVGELWGDVLADNRRMLELMRGIGFAIEAVPGETGILRVRIRPGDAAGQA